MQTRIIRVISLSDSEWRKLVSAMRMRIFPGDMPTETYEKIMSAQPVTEYDY